MPLTRSQIMQVLSNLADVEGIRVTVRSSVVGGLLTGMCATIGGVLLGPVGLAIGGAAGGGASYAMYSGRFRPLSSVIEHDMSEQQQILLASRVEVIFNSLDASDVTHAIILLSTGGLQKVLLQQVISFVTNEMKMQIAN